LEGKHGHSYEVDIWSLGVILYTMLVGRPPFETSDVKTTYRRIRYNQYSFPDTVRLSDPAKDLIAAILRTIPSSRPSLDEILASPWFQTSRLPPPMPATISGYSASPRPVGASARSETPERNGVAENNFARIDSPAPRFPLRDRSPGAAVQTPGAQVSQSLPRSQGVAPALPTKTQENGRPALTAANYGGTTPGRYPPGPNSLVGRPPLAHRGNEENVVPGTNAASDCIASTPAVQHWPCGAVTNFEPGFPRLSCTAVTVAHSQLDFMHRLRSRKPAQPRSSVLHTTPDDAVRCATRNFALTPATTEPGVLANGWKWLAANKGCGPWLQLGKVCYEQPTPAFALVGTLWRQCAKCIDSQGEPLGTSPWPVHWQWE